jgi:[ribosomal protein S5]-alanine N-acetyltransferase
MRIDCGDFEIRSWRTEDEDSVLLHADNPRVAANVRDRFPHPYKRSDARAFLRNASLKDNESSFAIAIGGEAVGGIALFFGDDIHRRTAELGYWLGENYWNRGIMTRAIGAFCEWAFRNYELDRIYANTFTRNLGSSRALEKAGFSLEGILRHSAVKNGELLDQALYALLKARE